LAWTDASLGGQIATRVPVLRYLIKPFINNALDGIVYGFEPMHFKE